MQWYLSIQWKEASKNVRFDPKFYQILSVISFSGSMTAVLSNSVFILTVAGQAQLRFSFIFNELLLT